MAFFDQRNQQVDTQYNIAGNIINPPLSPQEKRNRRAMLDKVEYIWIEGLLQHSLYQGALIELKYVELPDAVVRPFHMEVVSADRGNEAPAPGTGVIDAYDHAGKALLILGAPGRGKTTLLLELARDLIQRARDDELHPIPVVFQLSTWAVRRRPLAEWLVDELGKRYEVSRKIAQLWVNTNMILPLLDGLDEVGAEYRTACVDVINAFRDNHGLLPLVVTSRKGDYDALSNKLHLHSAIVVQPLSREQVRDFVWKVGLKVTPSGQSPLWDLLETPLFLNIATLVYAQQDMISLPTLITADQQRDYLFAAYVDRMFQRKIVPAHYTTQQAKQWLIWLAWQLRRHNQPILYVEQLQPDWLPDRRARKLYTILDRVGGGLIIGLGIGPLFGLLGGLDTGLFLGRLEGLIYGLGFGLIGGLIGGLFGGKRDRLGPKSRSLAQVVYDTVLGWLVIGLSYGLWVGLFAGTAVGLAGGFGYGLFGGLLGALAGRPGVHTRHIVVIEALRWSWSQAWRHALTGLVITLGCGALFGLGYVVFLVLFDATVGRPGYMLARGLVGGLAGGLGLGLVVAPLFGLLGGLTSSEVPEKMRPNQGVRRSGQRALLTGVATGLVYGLLFGVTSGLIYGLLFGLGYALINGLLFAITSALPYGGYACLSHFALRLVLWRSGAMPLRYIRFLESANSRVLLRRVGGGYIFVHGLLLDWFAKQYTGPETRQMPATPSAVKAG